jgi:MFS family permease
MSIAELEETAPLPGPPRTEGGAAAQPGWLAPPVAWYAVVMISLVTFCGQLDYGLISLLVQPIKNATHMSDSQLALLMGPAYSVVYLLFGVPMAWLSDRGRRTYVLSGALSIWSLGTAACGLVSTFWPFAAFRGVMGGAISVKGPTTVSIIPDLVPRDKLGRAFGIYNIALLGGQYMSTIAGGLLLGWLLHRMPINILGVEIRHAWQMVFILMGLPGLVVAAAVALTVPEPKRQGVQEKPSMLSVVKFMFLGPAGRVFIPTMIGTAMAGILLAGYGGWRAALFSRTFHMGAHVYGPLSGMIGLIGAPIGVIIGAFIAERMHRRWIDSHLRLTLIVHLITMPCYILTPLMPNATAALAVQFVLGVVMMVSAPSLLSAMQIITPNAMRARVNAIYMITISVLGNGLGPSVVAGMTDFLFHDPSQLRYAMVTLAAICTPVSLVCTWLTVKPYGRLYQQVKDTEAAHA